MMIETLTQPTRPTLPDPRVYQSVHFRLNSGDLRGIAPEDYFFPEIMAMLTQHDYDFTVKPSDGSGRCPQGVKEAEHLYAHPADLSGYVLEETIDPLQASLIAAQSFRVLVLDRYDRAYHYTSEEFGAALDACRDDIAQTIPAPFRTRAPPSSIRGTACSRCGRASNTFATPRTTAVRWPSSTRSSPFSSRKDTSFRRSRTVSRSTARAKS